MGADPVSEYDPADDCVKSYYAAIEAKRLRGDAEGIDELAQALFRANDSGGVWVALDYGTQLFWRRQAQQKVTAQRARCEDHVA